MLISYLNDSSVFSKNPNDRIMLSTNRIVPEEYLTPLVLHIEEDEEDTDHHGEDDADHHHQTTVHPHTGAHPPRFSPWHFLKQSNFFFGSVKVLRQQVVGGMGDFKRTLKIIVLTSCKKIIQACKKRLGKMFKVMQFFAATGVRLQES